MPHIRISRHYVHSTVLWVSLFEVLIATGAAYLGFFLRFQFVPDFFTFLPSALVFGMVVLTAMAAMGVYGSRIREGMLGMSLRTAVAIFLLATAGNAILIYAIPPLQMVRSVLLFASLITFLALTLFRWILFAIADENLFKIRVLVLGTGDRAKKIATRMRRRYDQRAFQLVGFFALSNDPRSDLVSEHGAKVVHSNLDILEFCRENNIDEIVVAMDERRRSVDTDGGLPLEQLIDCRMKGIQICDVQQFIEREASRVDVDLLRPSWLVFSDGFVMTPSRAFVKRSFDIVFSLLLLAISWPVMLLTALLIKLEQPSLPLLYKQRRVGIDGELFNVIKFRSMRRAIAADAEWTQQNDPRITRVGSFIRKTRIDELPQLFSVLVGKMSFVGPRPERPKIVEKLEEVIPFYQQRHRVKPGITGWAQLCYPYGASVEDAKNKLQYDLYYLKNHSLLLDMIIILQTVEVVLVGEGAR